MSFHLQINNLVLTVSLPQLLAIKRERNYFCICGSNYCHHSGMSMDNVLLKYISIPSYLTD